MFAPRVPSPVRIAVVVAVVIAMAAALVVSLSGSHRERQAIAIAMTGGDPSRGPALMRRYGCSGCHSIPGVPGADGVVGGPLIEMRKRVYVAGVLPNNADNLIRWITDPPSVNPRTAMPVTGISSDEARDVAAYLYTR